MTILKGKWYDVGCDDFAKAQANRERVALGKTNGYYDAVQRSLEATPLTARLPKNVPIGELPELIMPKEEQEDDD
jgi:hypothetical protein